jgi:hypothetical protein
MLIKNTGAVIPLLIISWIVKVLSDIVLLRSLYQMIKKLRHKWRKTTLYFVIGLLSTVLISITLTTMFLAATENYLLDIIWYYISYMSYIFQVLLFGELLIFFQSIDPFFSVFGIRILQVVFSLIFSIYPKYMIANS